MFRTLMRVFLHPAALLAAAVAPFAITACHAIDALPTEPATQADGALPVPTDPPFDTLSVPLIDVCMRTARGDRSMRASRDVIPYCGDDGGGPGAPARCSCPTP
jgi:hypothetical protein